MNIDDRPTDLRAHSLFGRLQMAITLQRVHRSPSCLVIGWGFRGWDFQLYPAAIL